MAKTYIATSGIKDYFSFVRQANAAKRGSEERKQVSARAKPLQDALLEVANALRTRLWGGDSGLDVSLSRASAGRPAYKLWWAFHDASLGDKRTSPQLYLIIHEHGVVSGFGWGDPGFGTTESDENLIRRTALARWRAAHHELIAESSEKQAGLASLVVAGFALYRRWSVSPEQFRRKSKPLAKWLESPGGAVERHRSWDQVGFDTELLTDLETDFRALLWLYDAARDLGQGIVGGPTSAVPGMSGGMLEAVKTSFTAWRARPRQALYVKMRRHRASELRGLFAKPNDIDLERWNSEVWRLETAVLVNGKEVGRRILADADWSNAELKSWGKALENGKFQFKGNACWRPGSKVYGSMLKGEHKANKLGYVRKAAAVLSDDSLQPREKVSELTKLPGLGQSTATGFVMLAHPDQLLVENAVTKEAFQKLGLPSKGSLIGHYAGPLKDAVGAEDYLELDAFLYELSVDTVHIDVPDPEADEDVPGDEGVSFSGIVARLGLTRLRLDERIIRRYHLSLRARGQFVILAGISGTGKTMLAEEYAKAVQARYEVVPIAPNWTTNEDLLGYHNPLAGKKGRYVHSAASRFLMAAAAELAGARANGRTPQEYYLILDEMNLARVEYYFAKFLSRMEQRAREGTAALNLGPDLNVVLGENLFVVGTVNIDETTHSFADKVYDRAQLIELTAPRDLISEHAESHLDDAGAAAKLMAVWDAVRPIAPFAFRVVEEVGNYVRLAQDEGVDPLEALDEQLLQKVLPRIRGMDPDVGAALAVLKDATEGLPMSHARVKRLLKQYSERGVASFF